MGVGEANLILSEIDLAPPPTPRNSKTAGPWGLISLCTASNLKLTHGLENPAAFSVNSLRDPAEGSF